MILSVNMVNSDKCTAHSEYINMCNQIQIFTKNIIIKITILYME